MPKKSDIKTGGHIDLPVTALRLILRVISTLAAFEQFRGAPEVHPGPNYWAVAGAGGTMVPFGKDFDAGGGGA